MLWLTSLLYRVLGLFPLSCCRKQCSSAATSTCCAARIFKTCNIWLFSQGHWPLFPWIIKGKRDNSQHNNSHPVWMNQNKPFFGQVGKKIKFIFGVPQNCSNEFMCAVRWRGWKSLVNNCIRHICQAEWFCTFPEQSCWVQGDGFALWYVFLNGHPGLCAVFHFRQSDCGTET